MGLGNSKIGSVRGLDQCPGGPFTHHWNSHEPEKDVCDTCGKETMCNITCENPKSRKLNRTCFACIEQQKQEQDRLWNSSINKKDCDRCDAENTTCVGHCGHDRM